MRIQTVLAALVISAVCGVQGRAQSAPRLLAPPPSPTPVRAPSQGSGPTAVGSSSRGLTITDVVSMRQAGLDDSVIIASLQQNGMASTLGATELISMRQHGVSNEVIQAMQQTAPLPAPRTSARQTAALQPAMVATPVVTAPTTVVRPVIVAPRYYYDPIYVPYRHHHHYHWRPHYCPRTASSFGIHIGF